MAGILGKYLVREFFKLLAICEGAFVFLYLIIDMISSVDNFMEDKVSVDLMFSYFFLKIPLVVCQMLPPATLIAVIILFALMKKNNEVILLNSCGLNIWTINRPLIMTSFFLMIGLFLCNELVVPYTSTKGNRIRRGETEQQDLEDHYKYRDYWYRGKKCIYQMKFFDSRNQVMIKPKLYFLDDSFHLTKRIDGVKGIWKGDSWLISNGIILQAKEGGKGYRIEKFDQINIKLPEAPDTFLKEEREPEEMGYWEMKRFIESLKNEGYDAGGYSMDLQMKIAFPFIVVLMVLIGVPISLLTKKGGAPVSVTIGLFACLVYLFAMGYFRSLGMTYIMPPIVAAWMANGLFLFAGVYLMLRVD